MGPFSLLSETLIMLGVFPYRIYWMAYVKLHLSSPGTHNTQESVSSQDGGAIPGICKPRDSQQGSVGFFALHLIGWPGVLEKGLLPLWFLSLDKTFRVSHRSRTCEDK